MFSTKSVYDLPVVGVINPSTVVNTEVFSTVIDMTKWGQVAAFCSLGNLAAETVDFKAYTCASDGTSSVALKACTQLAAHATNNDNTQLVMHVRSTNLGASRYIRFGLVTGGVTGGPASVLVLGADARHEPGTNLDLASVQQIKI